ncbi:hypothetical protein [Hoeflea olei]|nr:hypothetical protein [Hoeflea olei]
MTRAGNGSFLVRCSRSNSGIDISALLQHNTATMRTTIKTKTAI